MIKEALKYIVENSYPQTYTSHGHTYSDKPMIEIDSEFPQIQMSTLSGLVEYIKRNPDNIATQIILHVQSPTKVEAYTCVDDMDDRRYLAAVDPLLPSFPFGAFRDSEEFLIGLHAKFTPTPDLDLLYKFAGTAESGTVKQYSDDGVTQQTTVKNGVSNKVDAIVPNPVLLAPYRTFIEVPQPLSRFIFRMRQGHDNVECALFEADGGAWRNDAMDSIKEYLETALEDVEGLMVIA